MEEGEIGQLVIFGRPLGRKAIGKIEKINRITYQVRLVEPFHQVRRRYPIGSQFRVPHGLCTDFEEYVKESLKASGFHD